MYVKKLEKVKKKREKKLKKRKEGDGEVCYSITFNNSSPKLTTMLKKKYVCINSKILKKLTIWPKTH